MKRILTSPAANAVCISLFTAFYACIFFATAGNIEFERILFYSSIPQCPPSLWLEWSRFLSAGHHVYIALALTAATMLIVMLLMMRRHPYDEYHASILIHCLAVAAVLTLGAIAIFYFMILSEPVGIVEKFTLFIVIHWATVVLANLTYVLLCWWR